jgi:glutamate/tyrosine decarboxylase-like PLP-dependent enzyme
MAQLDDLLHRVVAGITGWQDTFGPVTPHPALAVDDTAAEMVLDELVERLRDNYPFFHPRYAGQMLKPPHPVAIAGYLAAMQINPNAHALDGGPATASMEREVVADLARMFGLPEHLGHLTSSGTIANLEALFVARETHPGRAVAYSAEAHYTHQRMCGVLGVEGVAVPADARGRMDLDRLADVLATGRVGTVVATTGTTGLGTVDPVHEVVALARAHRARVHVDAAYGGFFALLAQAADPLVDPVPWRAIADADSIVVDPHKHGLQPYGCGAVLFRDPAVGRHYLHDSPYTYFTSDELHLGEISLECSRAGAGAAALWTTLRLFPLRPDQGLGPVLAAGRVAALDLTAALERSPVLAPYQDPELDIVGYLDRRARTTSEVDASSARILAAGMADADPVFVSTLAVPAAAFAQRHPGVTVDSDRVRVLRSVLMKPEHGGAVGWLVERLTELAS